MSNELIETSPEIETIGEEAAVTPEPAPEATEGAKESPPEPVKTPEQIEIERLRRHITKRDRTQGSLHQKLQEREAEIERLRQRQPAQQTQQPTEQKQVAPEDLEREVEKRAEAVAARREFDSKCNSVAETGKKEFSDFHDALNALIEEAGPLVAPDGVSTPLGEQILDSDTPAKLIHYLGKHPEIAAELDGLSSGRIARKLVLIEQEMNAKPKVSAAPKPIEPVSGKSSASLGYSPEMTDRQFAKWRAAQRNK